MQKTRTENYVGGFLKGEVKVYDNTGDVIKIILYKNNELIEGTDDLVIKLPLPSFPGCDPSQMDDTTYTSCWMKLLQKNLNGKKYPSKARNEGIQGKVLIRFTVDEDGKIRDIMAMYPGPDILIDDVIKDICPIGMRLY